MKATRATEAAEVKAMLEARGREALYGGRKGHGFWIKGFGWLSMKDARVLAAQS